MSSRQQAEDKKVQRMIAGLPAPQALRLLGELVCAGGPVARGIAIAHVLDTLADTLEADQQVVRSGVPVDSAPGATVRVREYALRAVHPDGTELFTTYGDRLFSAVQDAAGLPSAEVLHREVAVGPWHADTVFHDEGV